MAKKKRIALVTYSREGRSGQELTVTKGEYLEVLDDEKQQWWKCRNSEGEVGHIPHFVAKAILYMDVRERALIKRECETFASKTEMNAFSFPLSLPLSSF